MKSVGFVIIVTLIAGCAGIAWHEARLAREATDTVAVINQERARTDAALQHATARLAALDKERADLRSTLEALPSSEKPSNTTADPQKVATIVAQLSEYLNGKFQEEQKDPTAQAAQIAADRARLLTSYGLLFRTLRLSPEQIEKFQDIVAKRDEQTMDLNDILREEGAARNIISAETWSAVTKLKAQTEAEYQAGMRDMLGEAGYRQLQDYDRTVAVRDLVSGFGGAAMMAGTPMTVQQAELLTQALAKASSSYVGGGPASRETVDWSVADPQARQILSESQWLLFTTVEPSGGGRLGSQYAKAFNEALKADSVRLRVVAGNGPNG